MSEKGYAKGPGVIVHPLLLFFATLIVGLILHFLFPIRFVNNLLVQLAVGVPVIGIGVGLRSWVFRTAWRAKTNLNPHSAASSLIVDGPFGYSRNPLYLSGVVILLGAMVALDSLWFLLLQIPHLLLLSLQVRREEEYLEARFGEEYERYKRRVRRWI